MNPKQITIQTLSIGQSVCFPKNREFETMPLHSRWRGGVLRLRAHWTPTSLGGLFFFSNFLGIENLKQCHCIPGGVLRLRAHWTPTSLGGLVFFQTSWDISDVCIETIGSETNCAFLGFVSECVGYQLKTKNMTSRCWSTWWWH